MTIWLGLALDDKYPNAPSLLQNSFWGGFILFLFAAFICSILGLVEYRKAPRYSSRRKGARYAVVTVLFCGVGLSFFATSLYTKKVYGTRNPFRGFTQEKRIRMIELGFQIYQPKYWVQVDGSHLSPIPCLAFTRINPSLSFSLIATKPGADTPKRIEDLIKVAQKQVLQTNTSANFSEPTISDESSASIASSAVFESLVTRGAFSYFYVHRLILYKGFAFQLVTWGPSNDPNSVRLSSELLGSKFSVLAL